MGSCAIMGESTTIWTFRQQGLSFLVLNDRPRVDVDVANSLADLTIGLIPVALLHFTLHTCPTFILRLRLTRLELLCGSYSLLDAPFTGILWSAEEALAVNESLGRVTQ